MENDLSSESGPRMNDESQEGDASAAAAAPLQPQEGQDTVDNATIHSPPRVIASLDEAPSDERGLSGNGSFPEGTTASVASTPQVPIDANSTATAEYTSPASVPSTPVSIFQSAFASNATQDRYTAMVDAPSPAVPAISASPSGDSSIQGGRLWRAAGMEAERQTRDSLTGSATQQEPRVRRTGPGSRIAGVFMEQTRSRADPNAVFDDPKAKNTGAGQHHMIRISKQDEALFLNTGLANKRVRVVQLLIIGLVALLLGWLGNFFVGTSCNFASVDVYVGQNSEVFSLHFGLWKYSPVDSAFNGYNYCYPYGENHKTDAPIVPRISNLGALLVGTYSLIVLWWYLISGRVVERYWRWAERMAIIAGVLQLSTLFFFVGRLCRRSKCTFGPASVVALVTAVAWLGLAWELHYNMPVPDEKKEEPAPVVTNLEMADLQGASQEYYERFSPRGQYQPPSIS